MPDALAAAGYLVEPHQNHFRDDAPDADWLPEAGRRGWVVLTKDHRIRFNPLEREALLSAGTKAFILTCSDMSGPDMADVLLKQLPAIERLARKTAGALIARVTRTEVALVTKGERSRAASRK